MSTQEKINLSENRAVLHTALRAPKNKEVLLEGKNIIKDVHEVLEAIQKFSNSVRGGHHVGATGKTLKNVVVIGIGGSYQSIECVNEALRFNKVCREAAQGRTLRFLANVDPVDFTRVTEGNSTLMQALIQKRPFSWSTPRPSLQQRPCLTPEPRGVG